MSKKTRFQSRDAKKLAAFATASNRQRRRAVMKGVRADERALADAFTEDELSDAKQFLAKQAGTIGKAGDEAELSAEAAIRLDVLGRSVSHPVSTVADVKAALLVMHREIQSMTAVIAHKWSAPFAAPKSPANFELLAMNVIFFHQLTEELIDRYQLTRAEFEALDVSIAPAWTRAAEFSMLFWDQYGEFEGERLGFESFLGPWLGSCFARLEVGHQLAAALACTDVPETIDVRAPWEAWSLIVPDGLFDPWGISRVWCLGTEWVATIVKEGFAIPPAPADHVVGQMVRSLIRGACLAIESPEQCRKPTSKGASAKHRHGLPDFQQARFLLAKPVSIDLRAHVSAASHGHAHVAPKVQFLVRGHWREQAHGPKRELRKRIWIEPFWKGPDDSRILLRSHSLKESQ